MDNSNNLKTANSSFGAFVQLKCPQCRTGRMFKTKPYSKSFNQMEEDCEVCGLHYEIETGFFWGSMYVSYAFTVAISVTLAVSMYVLFDDPEVWQYLAVITGTLLILTPILFRYSRVLMLHIFSNIKYNEKFLLKK